MTPYVKRAGHDRSGTNQRAAYIVTCQSNNKHTKLPRLNRKNNYIELVENLGL